MELPMVYYVGTGPCWLPGVLALESFQVGSGLLNTI